MVMSFLNALPLPVLVLLGFAVLGFCNYLMVLYTYRAKIKMFSNYKNVLTEFHNNAVEGKGIDPELSDHLLENSMRIYLDSVVKIEIHHPISILTGFVHNISQANATILQEHASMVSALSQNWLF